MAESIIVLYIIFIISICILGTILGNMLYKKLYKPKIDILQTLDGKYIPTVDGKFIWLLHGEPRFHKYPEYFLKKSSAEDYLYEWLNRKGLGLKSVGLDKDIEL